MLDRNGRPHQPLKIGDKLYCGLGHPGAGYGQCMKEPEHTGQCRDNNTPANFFDGIHITTYEEWKAAQGK